MTALFSNIPKSTTNLIESYETFASNFPLESDSSATYVGQSFKPAHTTLVDSVSFYLQKLGDPTIPLYAYIYNHTGTFDSNGTPTGSPIAISDEVDPSTLNEITQYYTYNASSYSESNYDDNIELGTTSLETITSYPTSNYNTALALYNGYRTYQGISFTCSNNFTLNKCQFYIYRWNSPTGTVVAQLYEATGNFGTNGTPTGSPLATSDELDVSTLTVFAALRDFTFSGDQAINLTADTNYFIVLHYTGGDASNYVAMACDTISPTAPGNTAFSNNGTSWTGFNTADLIFYIFGDTRIYDAVGQVFTNTNMMTLTSSKFYAKKTGSPTGSAYAYLWTVYPVGSDNDGQPFEQQAVSDPVDVSTWTTSMALRTFTFSGDQQFEIQAGQRYAVYIRYTGGDASNYITIGIDSSSPTDPDNFLLQTDDTWLYDAPSGVNQLCYYVIGESTTDYGGSTGGRTENNPSWVDFTFSGNDRIVLQANKPYFIVLHTNDPNAYANTSIVGIGTSQSTFPVGNWATSTDGSTWTPLSIFCIDFKLYGVSQWKSEEKSMQGFNNNNI